MRRTLEVIASTSRLEPYVKIIAASPVRRMRATGSWRKSVWSHTPERTRGSAHSNRTAGEPPVNTGPRLLETRQHTGARPKRRGLAGGARQFNSWARPVAIGQHQA